VCGGRRSCNRCAAGFATNISCADWSASWPLVASGFSVAGQPMGSLGAARCPVSVLRSPGPGGARGADTARPQGQSNAETIGVFTAKFWPKKERI
jgi:hypothetical protein